MVSRVKLAGSLSSAEVDVDDLNGISPAPKPCPTKRARGRPPGANKKVTKPTSKATRGPSKMAVAAFSTSAAQHLAQQGLSSAPPALLGSDETPSAYGDSWAGACPEKLDRVCLKPSKSSQKLKAGGSVVVAPAPTLDGYRPMMEIPDTQDVEILGNGQGEHLLGESSAIDFGAKPGGDTAGNGPENVAVRRRLGDLTTRYKNLEMRHRDLQEMGIKAAERNFDRLRKQGDENIAVSNRLISQLKDDIAAQSELIEQGQELRLQLERSEATSHDLRAELEKLRATLGKARGEIATLSAKLSASRNIEAGASASNAARKPGSAGCNSGALDVVQVAQAKEDLYGDLTGLIVRGLKRWGEEDVFDCIQTGRNGSLHFKLALERGGDNYEDAQLTYRPQLDEGRDSDLIELLPDYLVEEITFPRSHASKFYSRVIRSLSERTD